MQLSRVDAFVAAIGGDGSLAWWQALGGTEAQGLFESNGVYSIAVTPDGDALVVGEATLPLQIGAKESVLSVVDAPFAGFLARFGHGGALESVQSLGSVQPRRIVALPDGDFVVSAQGDDDMRYLSGKAALPLTSAGLTDMVLARHAPDGTLRWATHIGGDGNDRAGRLAVDSRGALFVSGWSRADFALNRPGCEALPVRVVARDRSNAFLFRVEPGGNPSDRAREVEQRQRRQRAEALRTAAKEATRRGDEAGALCSLPATNGTAAR